MFTSQHPYPTVFCHVVADGNLSKVVILLGSSFACFRLSNNGRHTSHDLDHFQGQLLVPANRNPVTVNPHRYCSLFVSFNTSEWVHTSPEVPRAHGIRKVFQMLTPNKQLFKHIAMMREHQTEQFMRKHYRIGWLLTRYGAITGYGARAGCRMTMHRLPTRYCQDAAVIS